MSPSFGVFGLLILGAWSSNKMCVSSSEDLPFFYDIKNRLEPVMKQATVSATHGIFQAPQLKNILSHRSDDISDKELNKLQQEIRRLIVLEMGSQVNRNLVELHNIANIVQDFTQELSAKFHVDVEYSEEENKENQVKDFMEFLIHASETALKRIYDDVLRDVPKPRNTDLRHLNPKKMHQLAALLARRILKDSQWSEIQKRTNLKVQKLLEDRILSFSNTDLKSNLDITLSPRTVESLSSLLIDSESELNGWIEGQVKVAVAAAAKHVDNLNMFAEEVIDAALSTTKQNLEDAVDYYLYFSDELTPETRSTLEAMANNVETEILNIADK